MLPEEIALYYPKDLFSLKQISHQTEVFQSFDFREVCALAFHSQNLSCPSSQLAKLVKTLACSLYL